MVKLLEKGDLDSKIAKVSILLLCAVARGVREKERIRVIANLLKLERNVVT